MEDRKDAKQRLFGNHASRGFQLLPLRYPRYTFDPPEIRS
jgi:hypothetical protein